MFYISPFDLTPSAYSWWCDHTTVHKLTVLGFVRFLASVSQLLRWLYVLLLVRNTLILIWFFFPLDHKQSLTLKKKILIFSWPRMISMLRQRTVSVLYNRFSLITFRMLISFKLILAYQFLICWILIAAYKFWIQVQTRETTSNYSFDVSTCTTLKPYFSIVKHQLLCKAFTF